MAEKKVSVSDRISPDDFPVIAKEILDELMDSAPCDLYQPSIIERIEG